MGCALFAVLRPYAQRNQLRTSAQMCAAFFADCLYLVHALLLMPYMHHQRLSKDQRHIALFIDMVPQPRRLGENHFSSMLRWHQEKLTENLQSINFSGGIAQDRVWNQAEAALGMAVSQVKSAKEGLTALPLQLRREVASILLGVLSRDLLSKLFKLHRVSPDEIGGISALFRTLEVQGDQVFASLYTTSESQVGYAGQTYDITKEVPGWGALRVVADLLGSGFQRFLGHRAVVLKALRKDEAVKLMALSWRDEGMAPEDAWVAMNNAK